MNLQSIAQLLQVAALAQRQGGLATEQQLQLTHLLAEHALGPGGAQLYQTVQQLGLQLPGPRNESVLEAQWRELPVRGTTQVCTGELCRPEYRRAGEARLVQTLTKQPYGVIYFLGREGTGKTAASMRLLELWDRKTYVLGIPQQHLPPGWHALTIPEGLLRPARAPRRAKPAHHVEDEGDEPDQLEEVLADATQSPFQQWLEHALPVGSAVLVDDATLVLDSMAAGSTANRVIRNLIAIMRHRELNLVINTQVAAAVTKYALNAKCLFLKPPVRRWELQERRELQPLYAEVEQFWRKLPQRAWLQHCWADSDVYSGPVHFTLPTFWTDRLSRNKGD